MKPKMKYEIWDSNFDSRLEQGESTLGHIEAWVRVCMSKWKESIVYVKYSDGKVVTYKMLMGNLTSKVMYATWGE